MKLAAWLLAGAAVVSAACDGTQKLSNSDYKLDWVNNANHAKLAAHMKDKNFKVSLTSVLDDGNHQMTQVGNPSGSKVDTTLMWERKDDFNDEDNTDWFPQGISSTSDAFGKGDWNGRRSWVVSWYQKSTNNVRVTFIDMNTFKYRHALLVWPTASDDFGPARCHAGGIVWYGDTLWVVDTNIGLRRFDLSNVWRVSAGSKIGKDGDKYSAANYRYVIGQTGYYKIVSSPDPSMKWSFCSLDRSESPDTLLVGEWQPESGRETTRIIKFNFDYTTRMLSGGNSATAKMAYCVGTHNMQGAVSFENNYYISRTSGEMVRWKEGEKTSSAGQFWTSGNEDLSYDFIGDNLYSLSEKAGSRYVYYGKRPA